MGGRSKARALLTVSRGANELPKHRHRQTAGAQAVPRGSTAPFSWTRPRRTPSRPGARPLLAMPKGSIISHHTAAELRGLPVPKSAEIHVTVPGRTAPRVAGIRAHLGAESAPVETYKGLLITPRPRLWLDLAAHLDRVELVVLGTRSSVPAG